MFRLVFDEYEMQIQWEDVCQWPWTNHLSLLWIYPYTISGFICDNKDLFLNLKLDCVGINKIKKEYSNW